MEANPERKAQLKSESLSRKARIVWTGVTAEPKNHSDMHSPLSMMDDYYDYQQYGVRSVDSRRTDPTLGPTTQGPPKRSGGTLTCYCATRVQDSRLHATGSLKILQWNAEGLQHKKAALAHILKKEKIDVACIQETHLNGPIRCTIRGYEHFRKDREDRHKGGVITYVRNDIAANIIETNKHEEIIAVKITKSNQQYVIYNCYCPPSEPLPLEGITAHENNFVVLGDFNSHSPSWGYNDLNMRGEELENWITSTKLQLLINEDDPDTYFSRAWKTTSTPDLSLLSENIFKKATKAVKDQLAGSDHRPIIIEISENSYTENKMEPPRWNYKKADWVKFAELTNKYSQTINCKVNKIDATAKELTKAILKASYQSIPRGSRKDYSPGWNDELDILNTNVSVLRETAEKDPTNDNVKQYMTAEAELKKKIIENKQNAWHEMTEQLDLDKEGRKLWRLTKALNGEDGRYSAPAIEDENGTILNKKQAANKFIEQYKRVGEIEISYYRKREVRHELNNWKDSPKENANKAMYEKIKMEELEEALRSVTLRKSPGPDEITNDMLVHLGVNAKKKMTQLFNTSWKLGRLPQIWKQATMIPILKPSKPKHKPESYRPISLTSCMGKLMERIVNSRLLWYLETNKILSNEQAGFRKFRNTEDQVAYISQLIEDGFQAKKCTVNVWVDMEKAFDKVWTKGLLLKLRRANISHNLYSWIKNYLTNRKAKVQNQNAQSKTKTIKNGVPQGGVLSPTLFILFINDIKEAKCNGVKGAMYADDLALISTEQYIGTAKARLQMTLDELSKWTEQWGMKINANKTTYTIFNLSTKGHRISLKLDDKLLKEDKAPKYLGVNFDPRLCWKHQVEESQKKGMKRMQLLRKLSGTSWGASTSVLKKTYLGYVRPALDYGIAAWGTCSNAQMQRVETVQNHCLRIITGGMKTTPIHKMETLTGMKSLNEHRNEKLLRQYTKTKFMNTQPLHPRTKERNNNRLKRINFITMGQKLETEYNLDAEQNIKEISVPNKNRVPWKRNPNVQIIRHKHYIQLDEQCHKEKFIDMINNQYPEQHWIRVYTDGSVNGPMSNGGAGVYIEWTDKTTTRICTPVSTKCTSRKAEERAIYIAMEELKRQQGIQNKRIVIMTDSDDALQTLQRTHKHSTESTTIQTLEQLSEIAIGITLQWIPGHIGIPGNTMADKLSKEGANMEQPTDKITYEDQIKYIKQTTNQKWMQKHPNHNKKDPIHRLPRKEQVIIFRLRTGHNKLKEHMHKLKLEDSPTCPCGKDNQNAEHILMTCPTYNNTRKDHWPTPTTLNDKLYGSTQQLWKTADFIASIGVQP